MKYAVFTFDGHGLPIAYHLQKEGCDVIVGQVQDKKDTVADNSSENVYENPEDREYRLKLYDDLLEKIPAEHLIDRIKKSKSAKEYFVFFDFNNLFKLADELEMSGASGNFPQYEDHILELDRDKAKNFVTNHYPQLNSPEKRGFTKITEATKFLQKTSDIWVLKGKDVKARTVIPDVDDAKLAANQLIEALENNAAIYENCGFILESMISPVVELTPEKMYYNGEPISLAIDIENKPLGSGNMSIQTGCAADLVFPTNISDRINKFAFPPIIDQIAKNRKGWFIWDASILVNKRTGKMYFGEFCSNRPGYNAIFTEISQTTSADAYFSSIANGKNPMTLGTVGTSVRIFNLSRSSQAQVQSDLKIEYNPTIEKNLWLMDVYQHCGELETAGYDWNLAVVTSSGKTIDEAVSRMYRFADDGLSFEGAYYRPKFDFLSLDYPTSILNRFNYGIERHLYDVPFAVKVGEIRSRP